MQGKNEIPILLANLGTCFDFKQVLSQSRQRDVWL